MTTGTLDAALSYAARGWRVLPVAPRDKRPLIKEWQHAASCDSGAIAQWWNQWPGANVAIAMGPGSGIVDFETDGPEGETFLSTLFDDDMPIGIVFESARGKHRLFKYDQELPSSATISLPGGDLKIGGGGKGSYCLFPPSVHPSGKVYTWLVSPEEAYAPEIPSLVLAKLSQLESDPQSLLNSSSTPPELRRVLENGIAESSGPFGGRNNSALKVAGHYLRILVKGDADVHGTQEAWRRVVAWNRLNKPPLDEAELRTTFNSCANTHRRNLAAEQSPAPIAPPLQTSAVVKPPNGSDDQFQLIRKKLDLPVASIKKYGRIGGQYELVLTSGESIVLGTAKQILSPAHIRAAVFDSTARLIAFEKRDWGKIAEAIGQCAEIVSTATDREMFEDALQEFDRQHEIGFYGREPEDRDASQAWWQSISRHMGTGCVRDCAGSLLFRQEALRKFLSYGQYPIPWLNSIQVMLRRIGFEPVRRGWRDECGKACSMRLWKSAPNWGTGKDDGK